MWKQHMVIAFKCTSHRIKCVNVPLIQTCMHACTHAIHNSQYNARIHWVMQGLHEGLLMSHTHVQRTLPKFYAMLCCVLFCFVLRTHINAQHRSPHAQRQQTKKKRKHILIIQTLKGDVVHFEETHSLRISKHCMCTRCTRQSSGKWHFRSLSRTFQGYFLKDSPVCAITVGPNLNGRRSGWPSGRRW